MEKRGNQKPVTKRKPNGDCSCLSGKMERFILPSLLLFLSEKPSYGYELSEKLGCLGFHEASPDLGAVYRYLRRMEEEGLVESEWETADSGPAKRNYRVTREGLEALHQWAGLIEKRKNALEKFIKMYHNLFEKK